jgi:hypothetical protein
MVAVIVNVGWEVPKDGTASRKGTAMDTMDILPLEGYLDLGDAAAQLGVSKQTGHYYAFKVGAFPGLMRVGLHQPMYLVPAEEVAAFAAKRAEHTASKTRMRGSEHRNLDPADTPALPGWLSLAQAAECLGVTPQSVQYMIEHDQVATVRRVNRRNSVVLRTAEVEAIYSRRVRAWALAQGMDVVAVDFAVLDKAYRSRGDRSPVRAGRE